MSLYDWKVLQAAEDAARSAAGNTRIAGHSLGVDLASLAASTGGAYIKATNPFLNTVQNAVLQNVPNMAQGVSIVNNPVFKGATRALPVLGAVSGVMGAADVIAGPDSFANKAMDTAAMTIGGILGAPGGPMGIAAGAGGGKMVSDSLQWLFGDKKTAEQRKMEEALAALGGRV